MTQRGVGTGATSSWALEPALAGPSLDRALRELDELRERLGADPFGAEPLAVDRFPFRDVLTHYQVLGRNAVDQELAGSLRGLAAALPEVRSVQGRMLASWLPCTFDHEDATYDSYAAIPMLEELAAAHHDTDDVLDDVIVALLADLLLFEATALAASPTPAQRLRTQACLRAVTRAGELAPRAHTRVPAVDGSHEREPARLLVTATELARAVRRRTPTVVRTAVGIAMLPMTTLHDEVMFIRCVQVLELVYRRLTRRLERAVLAMRRGELGEAVVQVEDAAARLAATTILFRVLTTMPREVFAVIREHTRGRSAVQSRAFREMERICAPGRQSEYATPVRVDGPTLQEVYQWRLGMWGRRTLSGLTDAMAVLDQAWRGMKRTHWGVTLKIIGRAPGTGGTTGADYLEVAAARPLFPELHAPAQPGSEHGTSARIA